MEDQIIAKLRRLLDAPLTTEPLVVYPSTGQETVLHSFSTGRRRIPKRRSNL
jgi:hypothetical protein